MISNIRVSKNVVNEGFRGFVAIAVSLLMIPYGQQSLLAQDPQQPQGYPQQQDPQGYPQPAGAQGYPQQAPPPANAYMPLGAEQLNQLVAPIALYPDSLVAQVLTASTYPQQVTDANSWMQQYGGMPPEQRAATADTMPWDPSIKALTAFPDVISNLARNQNWTNALGNAYYNQPGDVMNAVQAMRFRAQQAGTLRSTPQTRVVYEGGLVVIEPVNPGFVYLPYYNPWVVYGGRLSPWGGYYVAPPPRGVVFAVGMGIGFTAAIALGGFAHYGWGYHNWSPNWHGGTVVYNHNTYISHSTTIINRGNFGGSNRGVYERPGPGVPNNFHAPVTPQTATFHGGAPGTYRGSGYSNGSRQAAPMAPQNTQGRQFGQQNAPAARPQGQPAPYAGRPAAPAAPASPAYSRPAPQAAPRENRPAAPAYSRPAPQAAPQQHAAPAAPAARPEATHSQAAPQHQQERAKPAPRHEEEKR